MNGVNSNRLKDKKETILKLWEVRCLKEVQSAETVTRLALRNSLPLYLDHLSEALATNRKMDFKSVFAHDKEAGRIGRLHGSDRADSKSYALTEVIVEYHILREVIFQVLEKDGPLAEIQRDIVYDSLEQAVNDAAVEFSETHTEIQQKFVNTLTHDLKTPITSAQMNAQLILSRPDAPQAFVSAATRIVSSMNRLTRMIHDLLDTARIRAGEPLSLQLDYCDLGAVLRDVVDEMALTYGDRLVLDSKETLEGNFDSDALRRAVENLISNAVKYGRSDTPITVSLKRGTLGVELSVHNEGEPIPAKEVPLLFQIFKRSKNAHEGTDTGWGLGLTVVKGVVDAHKGKVRVESAEGKGTRFILEIPFGDAPVSEVRNDKVA